MPDRTQPVQPNPAQPNLNQPNDAAERAIAGEAIPMGEAIPAGEAIPTGAAQPDDKAPTLLTMADPAGANEPPDPKRRQLRANLTPDELREFLAGADSDIQAIASGTSGIQDPQEAFAEMRRISEMKLEAARRLQNHADANADARSDGARGELQSLSHLAALGDLKSAMALEKLATANLDSDDAALVTDSRLVLIGFAIESLQNGEADAPQRIVQLVKGLANSDASSDIPAMMVMGQARQVLTQFDHDTEAKAVRDTIIELYADSSDPQIAKMAAQLAGNVQFDEIDRLLQQAIEGESIETRKWADAVDALLTASPDLQTVQYLAGAALQFEGLNQYDLAEATYSQLQEQFPDPNTATGQEVQLAVRARESRVDAIGKTFDPDLKSIDGGELSIADYRGKI
ncbi:Redoxin domain protein, partial [Rhodopirellula maiorica SM1]